MDLGKKVQEAKQKTRGFFAFRDKQGNLIGHAVGNEFHMTDAISQHVYEQGLTMSREKNIAAGQLNFNNFRVDELANRIDAQRGTEFDR